VAEGVESADQAALLEGMGCALAQGYHFSRPVAADAVSAWLDAAPTAADAPAGVAAPERGRALAAV
jgi:EAL domain-containing protein (putative c-di-GMP-specific phosphodiesterase class I)